MAVPPEKTKAAEDASTLFHIALVQIGSRAVEDALALWEDVPPVPGATGAATTQRWLATAVRYVMRRRLRARDLAFAYYRYQRALLTGTTVAIPGHENPPYMTLPELRRAFEDQLTLAAPEVAPVETPEVREVPVWARENLRTGSESQEGSESGSEADAQSDDAADEERIPLESIDDLEADLDAIEAVAEQEIEAVLRVLGPINQERKLQGIELGDDETVDDLDAARSQAHREAGQRQAAAVERVVLNGARGPKYHVATRDRRVIGYVRVSRTGTPCGWCAMLISRGFTPKSGLYSSERAAQHQGADAEEDKYHDNCKCDVVAIYDRVQLQGDQFALNRYYADLWPTVTNGLSGKAALRAWRRFIRDEAKSQKSQEAAA